MCLVRADSSQHGSPLGHRKLHVVIVPMEVRAFINYLTYYLINDNDDDNSDSKMSMIIIITIFIMIVKVTTTTTIIMMTCVCRCDSYSLVQHQRLAVASSLINATPSFVSRSGFVP